MLMPKRVKHRKVQRGRRAGLAKGGTTVSFGDFGLMAEEVCWLTSRQIEAARRAMTHHIKRGGRVWIRVFPDKPVTKKPAEVRMGSGKGAPDHWVAVVKPGRVMFEMSGVAGADRARGDAPRRPQAADQHRVRRQGGPRAWTSVRCGPSRTRTSRARCVTRSRSCGRSASTSPRDRRSNYSRLPATRKRIARILTVMTERQHAAERAAADAEKAS